MATLSEHADNIKAAIQAAQAEGFKLEADIHYGWDGMADVIELDIWDSKTYWNVYREDRS